jgi:hypothetical protein
VVLRSTHVIRMRPLLPRLATVDFFGIDNFCDLVECFLASMMCYAIESTMKNVALMTARPSVP